MSRPIALVLTLALAVSSATTEAKITYTTNGAEPTTNPKPVVQRSLWRSVVHAGDQAAKNTAHKFLSYVRHTVTALRHTRYVFGGKKFDTTKGIYAVDCSEYVNKLVALTNPQALYEITNNRQTTRANSADYYHFLGTIPYGRSSSHWYHVRDVNELRPGDILVYSSPSRHRHRRSPGHMMIVVDIPKLDPNIPGIYHVRVADSAHSGHSNDTRRRHTSGIGVGTILIKAHPKSGAPIAYAWREDSRWKFGIDFAMGRMIG